MKQVRAFSITLLILTYLWNGSLGAATDASSSKNKATFYTSADTGIAVVDEDLFIPLLMEQGFAYKAVDLAISGPFRFRVHDNSPQDTGTLRAQDWDTASDWARILRKFHFSKHLTRGELDAFLGELNGVHMGHQNLVSHYFNSVDMDHYQGGLDFNIDIDGNGFELLINDVIRPTIFAGRVHLAPMGWFSDHPLANRLQVGFHLFVDSGVPSRTMNTQDTHLVAAGGDVGFSVVQNEKVELTPYIVVAGMDGDAGFHAGATLRAAFSPKKQVGLRLQSEYRYAGEDYYPALVNPFYDHNRRFFTTDPATDTTNTFTDHLANTSMNTSSAHGFMVDVELQLTKGFRLGTRYDFQAQNRPHWLFFRLEITASEKSSFRALYGGQDTSGGKNIFSFDSLMGLAYQHQIVGPLRTFTEFTRKYRRLNDDTTSIENEYIFGLGLLFAY